MTRIPIIATPELSDAGTLTTNSASAATPVTNLQNMQPKRIWQSTTDTGVFLLLDLGSVQPTNLGALLFHNLSTSGTVRWRYADTSGGTTSAPAHDSTTLPAWQGQTLTAYPRRHFLYWPGTTLTNRWVRIDLEDATNPDGFLYAGRLYVSNAWQSPLSMKLGRQSGFEDLSTQRRSVLDGTLHTRVVSPIPYLQFVLGYLTEAQVYDIFFEVQRTRGIGRDILLVEDTPSTTTYLQTKIHYGVLRQLFANERVGILDRSYEQRIEIVGLV